VGVRTARLPERDGRASLPLEIWYPASRRHLGRDLDPTTRDAYEPLPGMLRVPQDAVRDAESIPERFPLLAFSHGFGGHRRQSTFLCTHLASHGYVVVAVDHVGNTMLDVYRHTVAIRAGEKRSTVPLLADLMRQRPPDLRRALDAVAGGAVPQLTDAVDTTRIGVVGHSFGGWTALTATARDRRVLATVALAPAGGRAPGLPDALADGVLLAWERPVPSLFVVADGDSVLPIASMHELYGRVSAPKRFATLTRTDHMHFCDRAADVHEFMRTMPPPGLEGAKRARPFHELRPAAEAYDAIRGLTLAHFDAALKHLSEADVLLDGRADG